MGPAHDADPKVLHRAPHGSGPGYTPGTVLNQLQAIGPDGLPGTLFGLGDQTGTASIRFKRKGVQLLSWLPPGWIDPNSKGANDCWGYVSPSGRE